MAEVLNEEWAATNVRVHHITAYYPGRGDDWAISQGVSAADVGSHAGTHDTSSLMYLNPQCCDSIRWDLEGLEMGRGTTATRAEQPLCSVSVFLKCRSVMPSSRFRSFA